MKRTLITSTIEQVGKEVKLQGWVDTKRDHGKVTFIDLRDRTGKVQCVGVGIMGDLSTESVIEIIGKVKERSKENINSELATGTIEVEVREVKLLNKAKELPILVHGEGKEVAEEIRLKYRYLDLRRERMQRIMRLRSKFIEALRQDLFDNDFVEIETPLLTKSTKEGARDFIVPSRFQPGKFYALPQSPQQYKQLLMTAGFERYFQVARCVRDEDLRADRGFEFTQLDLEMSFATQEEVMDRIEETVKKAVKAVGGKLKDEQFPVINYQDAISKYGADKFDIRTEEEKKAGVLAFVWVVKFPFFKKVDQSDAAEKRDGKSGWTFTHNPFSSPTPESLEDHLAGKNIGDIVTAQYDLVCNGYEAGGGSIRAHDPKVLKQTFKIMGYSDEEIEASIGHMLEAFEVGTPPHGGIALGLDRLVMILANENSLKEAIAFPMTSTGRTAVMDAPSEISTEQARELGLLNSGKKKTAHDFILDLLLSEGVNFRYFAHQDVLTSEEANKVRGVGTPSEGAKALALEADKDIIIYVLPGDEKADLKELKNKLGVKKLQMVSRDEVESKLGVKVGGVPPFGSSMGLKTYLDPRMAKNEQITFNCGRRDRSVRMNYEDFVKLERPTII